MFELKQHDRRVLVLVDGNDVARLDYAKVLALVGSAAEFALILNTPSGRYASLQLSTEQRRGYRGVLFYPLVVSPHRQGYTAGVTLARIRGPMIGAWCRGGFADVTGIRIRRAYYVRCVVHGAVGATS